MNGIKDTRNWQVSIITPGVAVEGIEDIAQCVYTILTTVKGSDPLRADFGSDPHKYIDKPMNEVQPILTYEVSEALGKWEKRIVVKKVRLTSNAIGACALLIDASVVASVAQIAITINV